MKWLICACLAMTSLSGCSTVMEAERPSAVNLAQFRTGESRIEVLSKLGAPMSNVKNRDQTCDVYSLYTQGVSKVGKGAIIFGEAAADVLTVGLTEALFTPAEAVTKADKHTVLFCYGSDNTLVSLTDEGKGVIGAPTAASLAPSAPPSASAPPAPASAPAPEARPQG